MKRFKFTFKNLASINEGSQLLHMLGHTGQLEFSDEFELELEEWQLEDLWNEFDCLGIEFSFKEI